MKKNFQIELIDLITKYNLTSEMHDTPETVLAQVCINAMAIFSEAIARRDEWRDFINQEKEEWRKFADAQKKKQQKEERTAGVLKDELGVIICRVRVPHNKRRFRKKPKKHGKNNDWCENEL